MKLFSGGKPLSPASARNCFLVNQFATPGLGSLMGGRIVAGIGQLLLAFLGAALFIYWIAKVMQEEVNLADVETPVSYGKWGLAGGCFFIASWLWSLLTSISLIREAKEQEPKNPPAAPPRITNAPPKI
jgi:hypothetical protein